MRKWKANKKDIEKLKEMQKWQIEQLELIKTKYKEKIHDIFFNENKSSLYTFLSNGKSYRISTHHLPNKVGEYRIGYRKCEFVNFEIVTNSKKNIFKKLIEILESEK